MDPHRPRPATPAAMFLSFFNNRQLILQMTRRQVVAIYRGSLFGVAWLFINPMLMLAIYTFVFSVIFKSHWGTSENESRTDFAIMIFVGMIVFGIFSEMLNRAPLLIVANINYVKKVVFPLEILPWVTLGSTLFHGMVSLFILLLAQLLLKFSVPWTVVFFPIVLLPLIFFSMGLAWFLAATGVFVRDTGQITGVVTTVLMFLSALFYPLSALPEIYQTWLKLNPLVSIITESRSVLVLGKLPDWISLSVELGTSLMIAFAGFWWFQKVRKGFADVI